eukprot:scaffold1414_cov204-Alexandrium_tamarense.AAC.6
MSFILLQQTEPVPLERSPNHHPLPLPLASAQNNGTIPPNQQTLLTMKRPLLLLLIATSLSLSLSGVASCAARSDTASLARGLTSSSSLCTESSATPVSSSSSAAAAAATNTMKPYSTIRRAVTTIQDTARRRFSVVNYFGCGASSSLGTSRKSTSHQQRTNLNNYAFHNTEGFRDAIRGGQGYIPTRGGENLGRLEQQEKVRQPLQDEEESYSFPKMKEGKQPPNTAIKQQQQQQRATRLTKMQQSYQARTAKLNELANRNKKRGSFYGSSGDIIKKSVGRSVGGKGSVVDDGVFDTIVGRGGRGGGVNEEVCDAMDAKSKQH